ncbi:hypothetical protein GMSM_13400 [Geomonas sp. Red276]
MYLSLPNTLRGISAALTVAQSQGRTHDVRALMAQGVQRLAFNSNHIIMLSSHLNDPSILDAGKGAKIDGSGLPHQRQV